MTKDFSLDTLPYFTLSQVSLFYNNKKEASTLISNRLRQNKISKIREGIYTSNEKIKELTLSGKLNSFLEFTSTNLIYTPSYLSLEYVLFINNILTENVYNFTLVTTKKTAIFKNSFGVFSYRSIKEPLFSDYEVHKKDGFSWYQATPEKALFDYFYLKRDFIFSIEYLNELRINWENVNLKKFEQLVNKYDSKKVKNILQLIKKALG